MAVTIDAPPHRVWPWLVQMGGDRGGWYSWDHLDNAGRPSARKVHPEWQDISVGEYLKFWATGRRLADSYAVAVLDENRFLGLHGLSDLWGRRNFDPRQPRPSAYIEGLWGFLLKELPGGRTRLVIGGYQALRPRWLERFVFYWLYPRPFGLCRHACWRRSNGTSNRRPPCIGHPAPDRQDCRRPASRPMDPRVR